jgi:hypothetical protein
MNQIIDFVSAPEHVAFDVKEKLLSHRKEQEKECLFIDHEKELELAEQEKDIYFNHGRHTLDIIKQFHLDEIEFITPPHNLPMN